MALGQSAGTGRCVVGRCSLQCGSLQRQQRKARHRPMQHATRLLVSIRYRCQSVAPLWPVALRSSPEHAYTAALGGRARGFQNGCCGWPVCSMPSPPNWPGVDTAAAARFHRSMAVAARRHTDAAAEAASEQPAMPADMDVRPGEVGASHNEQTADAPVKRRRRRKTAAAAVDAPDEAVLGVAAAETLASGALAAAAQVRFRARSP